MKKFFGFLRKTWWLFLLLFLVPVVVIVYFYILEFGQHRINMSAGEWSALLGEAFGYWGTVLLGVLAFYQNEQVQENNEILTQNERRKLSPIFSATVIQPDAFLKELKLQICNQSENIACNFSLSAIELYKYDNSKKKKLMGKYKIINQDKEDYLAPRENVIVTFDTPAVRIIGGECVEYILSITATDIIGLTKVTKVTISYNVHLNPSYKYSISEVV